MSGQLFLVTVKLPRGASGPHNPAAKVTGVCPVSERWPELVEPMWCTDRTGEHHTVLVEAADASWARAVFAQRGVHVTRVEGPVPS